MLSRIEILNHVESTLKISPSHRVKYANEYLAAPHPFYIKSADTKPLVIHPDWGPILGREPISGVELEGDYYFNTALRLFPRLVPNRERCGCDLNIRGIPDLNALLVRIGAISASMPKISPELADIEYAEPMLEGLPETERQTLISARLGQGLFRDRLMSRWKSSCAITQIAITPLLRASHIKPWRLSDNRERLDPENGLLLMANLDAAFDAGLVSFKADGSMIFSAKLGAAPHDVLGIRPGAALTQVPSARMRDFLEYHRTAAGLG